MYILRIFPLILILGLSGCLKKEFREEKEFAGGVKVSAEMLNLGKTTYFEYCFACHGDKGDGNGVASKGLYPPPRDFTSGLYKFGDVLAGELPHDDTLMKIVRHGLKGTAMLPWDIHKDRLWSVVQYIKTFAPEAWAKDKSLGEKVVVSHDPYKEAHKTHAIQKGKEVYHVTAQCWTCHRAYVSKRELKQMTKKLTGDNITEFESDMYKIKIQESDYQGPTIPPDFTFHEVRSATSVKELYLRIAAGVGGTSMPPWKGTIEDDEIWAVSYYVKSLMDLKNNKKELNSMMDTLRQQ